MREGSRRLLDSGDLAPRSDMSACRRHSVYYRRRLLIGGDRATKFGCSRNCQEVVRNMSCTGGRPPQTKAARSPHSKVLRTPPFNACRTTLCQRQAMTFLVDSISRGHDIAAQHAPLPHDSLAMHGLRRCGVEFSRVANAEMERRWSHLIDPCSLFWCRSGSLRD